MSDPIRVRASSWGGLFDCAYRWEGTHLLGLQGSSGIRAALGTGLHASTAAYDGSRLYGASGMSVMDSASVLVDKLRDPGYEIDTRKDDITRAEAERIGLSLHSRYCAEWSPRFVFQAVELETKPLDVDCGNGVTIRLTGTLDRSRLVARSTGTLRVADLKSGGRAIVNGQANTKGHAAQVGTYEILYAHTTGMPVEGPSEIIGMQTTGKPAIARGEISGARELLTGTPEAPGLMSIAAQMFKSGLFPPNPSSMLCAEKYCSRWHRCPYHQ